MSVSTTISQLLEVLLAEPVNVSVSTLAQLASGIQTDTRILQPGEVFLALRG